MKHIIVKLLVLLVAAAALTTGASALTQTVNSSDSAATIQAAINAVLASADPAGEVVFNAGTYLLSASLEVIANNDGQITLRGASSANRPIIVCPNYTGATSQDGAISIGGANTTLTIRDMVILPPAIAGGGPTNANTIGIGGRSTLLSCTLNFVNLLITGNNGSNAPTSLDGRRDPALDAGVASRFANACINLVPSTVNTPTLIIGATSVICSQSLAQGFFCSAVAATGGCLKAHFYDSVFTWNASDGFQIQRIGADDRYYRCVFDWNGNGASAQQGINNLTWNPGTGVLGSSYFENCEASYNRDRGFLMGGAATSVVKNCTAIDNGNFFSTASETAAGISFDAGGLMLCEDFYGRGNRGCTFYANFTSGLAGSQVVVRRLRSDSSAVNNAGASTTYKSAITVGGEIILVEDSFVNNTQGMGIWADPSTAVVGTGSVTYRRNTVQNTGMSGICIWRNHTNRTALVENCTLINTANDPLRITNGVDRGNALTVRAPTLGAQTNAGDVTIRDCTIVGAAIGTVDITGSGIRVEAEATARRGTVVVSRCRVSDTTNACIVLAGGIVSVTDVSVSRCVMGSGIQILAATALTMADANVRDCSPHGISFGQEGQAAPAVPLRIYLLDHVVVSNSNQAGVRVLQNQITSPAWKLQRSTLFNNPIGLKMQAVSFSSQRLEIADSIIASASGIGVAVSTTLISPITVHHTGLVQEGAYALTTPTSDTNIPSIISTNNLVTRDPVFKSVVPSSADFLDVRSTAYGGKGVGGTNLSGWGDYIGDFVGIEGWRKF